MIVFVILQSEETRLTCQTPMLVAHTAAGRPIGRYGQTSALTCCLQTMEPLAFCTLIWTDNSAPLFINENV